MDPHGAYKPLESIQIKGWNVDGIQPLITLEAHMTVRLMSFEGHKMVLFDIDEVGNNGHNFYVRQRDIYIDLDPLMGWLPVKAFLVTKCDHWHGEEDNIDRDIKEGLED